MCLIKIYCIIFIENEIKRKGKEQKQMTKQEKKEMFDSLKPFVKICADRAHDCEDCPLLDGKNYYCALTYIFKEDSFSPDEWSNGMFKGDELI